MGFQFFSIPEDVLRERPAGGGALGEGPQPAHRRGDGVVVAVAVCPALEEARQRHGQRGGAAAHRALALVDVEVDDAGPEELEVVEVRLEERVDVVLEGLVNSGP